MTIDLSQLPAPQVIETLGFETLFAERKARLLELTPAVERAELAARLALTSDPITKLLEENAYRELLLRQRINEAARAVMLSFANDSDLDQIGGNYNVQRLVDEPDIAYRARIQLSFEGFSTAGPEGAYRFHALSAHPDVLDASAHSPLNAVGDPTGRVIVTILSRTEGETTTDEQLTAVFNALNDDEVRPLTDLLTVQPADLVDYAISARLYTLPGPDRQVVLDAARTQLNTYIADRYRLGRDITLSGLYQALHAQGTQRVHLISPLADIVVTNVQAARCINIDLQYGGADD